MNYENYATWKGWLQEIPFGSLSEVEEKKFELQMNKVGVNYQNIKVLDIGFGNGSFMSFIKKNNSKIEGVEIQKALLEEAKNKGITVYESLAEIKEGSFDLIVAFDVLEHLTVEQLKELFINCKNLIKENGVMLFRFPNADSFLGMSAQNGDFTHITAIGKQKLHQIITPIGLQIHSFQSAIIYPRGKINLIIKTIAQYILMKLMDVGNSYFFGGDVIAIVKNKNYTAP